jgi:transcriptional regulator with XRE-family HTH domain
VYAVLEFDGPLISAFRRSAEEYVPEDWTAVATAVKGRVRELGLTQRELAQRSNVSLAIVREIQRNTAQRRRSARTLEALSVALGWHPRHLDAVAHGRRPPEPTDPPGYQVADGVPARLEAMDDRLNEIAEQLAELNANLAQVNANIATVIKYVRAGR